MVADLEKIAFDLAVMPPASAARFAQLFFRARARRLILLNRRVHLGLTRMQAPGPRASFDFLECFLIPSYHDLLLEHCFHFHQDCVGRSEWPEKRWSPPIFDSLSDRDGGVPAFEFAGNRRVVKSLVTVSEWFLEDSPKRIRKKIRRKATGFGLQCWAPDLF